MLPCSPCPAWKPNLAERTHHVPFLHSLASCRRPESRAAGTNLRGVENAHRTTMFLETVPELSLQRKLVSTHTLHCGRDSACAAGRMLNLTVFLHSSDTAPPLVSRRHTAWRRSQTLRKICRRRKEITSEKGSPGWSETVKPMTTGGVMCSEGMVYGGTNEFPPVKK